MLSENKLHSTPQQSLRARAQSGNHGTQRSRQPAFGVNCFWQVFVHVINYASAALKQRHPWQQLRIVEMVDLSFECATEFIDQPSGKENSQQAIVVATD